MTASVNDLQRVLGQQYRIERELGAGGMATVYLAHDPKHDRQVATQPELRVTSRTTLFRIDDLESAAPHPNYDVTPVAKFEFVRTARATEIIYVQNWTELVRQRSTGR